MSCEALTAPEFANSRGNCY